MDVNQTCSPYFHFPYSQSYCHIHKVCPCHSMCLFPTYPPPEPLLLLPSPLPARSTMLSLARTALSLAASLVRISRCTVKMQWERLLWALRTWPAVLRPFERGSGGVDRSVHVGSEKQMLRVTYDAGSRAVEGHKQLDSQKALSEANTSFLIPSLPPPPHLISSKVLHERLLLCRHLDLGQASDLQQTSVNYSKEEAEAGGPRPSSESSALHCFPPWILPTRS